MPRSAPSPGTKASDGCSAIIARLPSMQVPSALATSHSSWRGVKATASTCDSSSVSARASARRRLIEGPIDQSTVANCNPTSASRGALRRIDRATAGA